MDQTTSTDPDKNTSYLNGVVYENDALQFFPHEEGRIRPPKPDQPNVFAFDYFVKDHLGNVRMVLTDELQTDAYPVASMENHTLDVENLLYSKLPETRTIRPPDYPSDNYTNPNQYVARLNGNGHKIGPGIVLKVMAGDRFHLRANSWYKTWGQPPGQPANPMYDLIDALADGIARAGNKFAAGDITGSGSLTPGVLSFLTKQDNEDNESKPLAFVNWVLLDEQFRFVENSSGFEQVGDNLEFKTHLRNDLPISKSGYLYIYCSNETSAIDVFFDNLQVTHVRGPLLEETHYYPWGLTMAGISSKAMGTVRNVCKFNEATELENIEFTDGKGLEWYATNYRGLDPQIGRFLQIDPLSNLAFHHSTYSYASNNPILLNDPLGLLSTPENPEVLPEVVVTPHNNRNKSFQWFGWSSTVNLNFHISLNRYSQRRQAGASPVRSTDPSWYKADVQQFNMESWHQNKMNAREFEKQFYLAFAGALALPFLAPEITVSAPWLISTKTVISASAQAVTGGVDNIDVIGVAADALLSPGSGALINGAMSWRPFSENPTFSLVRANKTFTQAGIDFTTSFVGGKIGGLVGSNLPPLKGSIEASVVEFSMGVPNTFSMQIANTILNQKLSTQNNDK